MIQLIIFDLDGVLVDSKEMHYNSLNKALSHENIYISPEEQSSTYEGMSTRVKLNLLTEKKGLAQAAHDLIWRRKQQYTDHYIRSYTHDDRIRSILKTLKEEGYMLYVASNAIAQTVKNILYYKGFLEYIDRYVSNQDVQRPKPYPDIYFKCMEMAGTDVYTTLILEDSHIGREAVDRCGAHLLPIENTSSVTLDRIHRAIHRIHSIPSTPKWIRDCNVVIPMAGNGARFATMGYEMPKPLIDVKGIPMIQLVVQNLQLHPSSCKFIFIVQQAHLNRYQLRYILQLIAPGCVIIPVTHTTEGAACSVLLASDYIDSDEPLVIANSDQYINWEKGVGMNEFMYSSMNVDGGIVTFNPPDLNPKWSYAQVDENGFVSRVAEKACISDIATAGIYYYRKGSDFVRYANQMIEKNIRVNGEFYVCPVFNEFIKHGKRIKIFPVKGMYGIGTPDDLKTYLHTII